MFLRDSVDPTVLRHSIIHGKDDNSAPLVWTREDRDIPDSRFSAFYTAPIDTEMVPGHCLHISGFGMDAFLDWEDWWHRDHLFRLDAPYVKTLIDTSVHPLHVCDTMQIWHCIAYNPERQWIGTVAILGMTRPKWVRSTGVKWTNMNRKLYSLDGEWPLELKKILLCRPPHMSINEFAIQ